MGGGSPKNVVRKYPAEECRVKEQYVERWKISGNGVSAGQKRNTKTDIVVAVSSNVSSRHSQVCVRNIGVQSTGFVISKETNL